MAKQLLAFLLVVTLADECWAGQTKDSQDARIEQQIRALPADGPVEVRLRDGSKLRGLVSEVSNSDFVLTGVDKTKVTFSEVKSIKRLKNLQHSHTTRNVVIVAAVVAAVVTAVIATRGLVPPQ